MGMIEWTDRSDWNVVRGCTRVSPGCGGPGPHGGCYAETMAARFSDPGMWGHGFAERTPAGGRWTGKVEIQWDRLELPLKWRTPALIFANSTSDLFHEALPAEEIATIYAVAVAAVHLRRHTLQILTKRTERMRQILNTEAFWDQVNAEADAIVVEHVDPLARRSDDARATLDDYGPEKPPPGIWLGTSVEDQARADERIPHLLATPAAVRFLSCEPLLGPLDLTQVDDGEAHREVPREEWGQLDDDESPPALWWDSLTGKRTIMHGGATGDWSRTDAAIDWVIAGGESGPNARPMHPDWARSLRDQCASAGVPFFFKQWGNYRPLSDGDSSNWFLVTSGGDIDLPDGRQPLEEHGEVAMLSCGKKRSGRLLDGVEHNGMPEMRR